MKQTLLDLFTSKKFLAASTAVIVYLAGRFGFEVDLATLDRIYAAFLVYVGAQGIADAGKSAARINATRPANDNTAGSATTQLGAVGTVLLVALALGVTAASLPACATLQPRERAANGADAFLDCKTPDVLPLLPDAIELGKQALKVAISGDGHVDRDLLAAVMSPLKSNLGRCGITGAVAALARPAPQQLGAPQAASLEVDGAELRATFASVRGELGWLPVRTADGAVL